MHSDYIAKVTHEANRSYCQTLGDNTQPIWADAPLWQRQSAINGVEAILSGDIRSSEQSHESWMTQKLSQGWTYGDVKDPEAKRHPCLVPFEDLPEPQKRKDYLFFAIVQALRGTDR